LTAAAPIELGAGLGEQRVALCDAAHGLLELAIASSVTRWMTRAVS
jgi:hypothetical protein